MMKTLAALVSAASAANTVPIVGDFPWTNTTTAVSGDVTANDNIGVCLRKGFIYCQVQTNLDPEVYDSSYSESAPTSACVFDDAAATTWVGSNSGGKCSNEYTSRVYALTQLAPRDSAHCGATYDVTNPTSTGSDISMTGLAVGEVCAYKIK
mmetsp:Transcript_36147/g.55511  ORF Transcript_36147/g.55511 Transcript_36147/m.55511 type:complete len:152 (-) Transcript_36147:345-800(-)